jgi:predicted DNA-binding transcriptional regulator AlpA
MATSTANPSPIVSLEELAKILGKSPATVRRWTRKQSTLPVPLVTGRLQWLRADLESRGILRKNDHA